MICAHAVCDEDVAAIHGEGQRVRPLIGQETKLAWPHGFDVTQYDLAPGFETDLASFAGRDVPRSTKAASLQTLKAPITHLAQAIRRPLMSGPCASLKTQAKPMPCFCASRRKMNA